ncbi:hypothetical protein M2282_000595 [Variovorax boronicumulans]|uniref:hypothetical protein n=1 Tax=Variovorax boronicumulans TaxID=436515 RepID=UPI002476D629|nr:hypothetical protein [Variovorax boronicumulans]MDH6165467.1 hypothetical protein [Variovorax boronicumulans]
MATSSILGGEHPPIEPKGTGEDSLGPSDSSDSGSDAAGTGDRELAQAGEEAPTDADILPDRIGVFPDAAPDVSTGVEDPDAASAEDLAGESAEDDEKDDDEDAENA